VIQTGIENMMSPGSIISIQSILTDDLANEYQRLQTQLNFHRKIAGVELKEFDQVSIVSGKLRIFCGFLDKISLLSKKGIS